MLHLNTSIQETLSTAPILSSSSKRIQNVSSSISDIRIQSCDWWVKSSGGRGNK